MSNDIISDISCWKRTRYRSSPEGVISIFGCDSDFRSRKRSSEREPEVKGSSDLEQTSILTKWTEEWQRTVPLSDEGQGTVPFSLRRHRLNGVEVNPVMEAVGFRLRHLVEEREDLLTAQILFRVHYRLREHITNRPSYPPHSTCARARGA